MEYILYTTLLVFPIVGMHQGKLPEGTIQITPEKAAELQKDLQKIQETHAQIQDLQDELVRLFKVLKERKKLHK